MTWREKYDLIFEKQGYGDNIEFSCYRLNNIQHYNLAAKLRLMHRLECEYLIEVIIAAENNEYYEEYFAIDRDAANDFDEIRISPPNVVIDTVDVIPFEDMKGILSEWVEFTKR